MKRRTIVLLVAGVMAMMTVGSRQGPAAEDGGDTLAKATFAGGCLWCTEAVYAQLKGVKAVWRRSARCSRTS
jgi:hypothetical protein